MRTDLLVEHAQIILTEATRAGSLVPFIGSGVSKGAQLPDWKTLLAPLRDEVGASPQADELEIAQYFLDLKGREALERHVRSHLLVDVPPTQLHRTIAELGVPVLCTTNYDLLLERAIEEVEGVPPDVIVDDADVGLIDEARRTTLVKLHGCLTLPDTIVLARDDYETYADRHRAMTAYLQSLLATRTFVFFGFSMTDPNFRSIYNALGRVLGGHRRSAYVLTLGAWNEAVERYWERKGVVAVPIGDPERLLQFARQMVQLGRPRRSALESVEKLASWSSSATIGEHLRGTRESLRGLIAEARAADWLAPVDMESESQPQEDDMTPAAAEPADAASEAPALQVSPAREDARALLDLAMAMDSVVPLDDPTDWVTIGELLYDMGDAPGAIRAYHAALRPTRDGKTRPLGAKTVRRVRGNLARALAREGHFARAEWLLRRCVFQPGQEQSDEERPSRARVQARLYFDAVRRRPSDASELVYAITVHAEQLLAAGRKRESFYALREARYLLEPFLGINSSTIDLFGRMSVRKRRPWRGRDTGGRPSVPKAWALNFLGKAYRLSALGALEGGDDNLAYYLNNADRVLHEASVCDPLLVNPYVNRLAMLAELPRRSHSRAKLENHLVEDLVKLDALDDGPALAQQLESRFPTALKWSVVRPR